MNTLVVDASVAAKWFLPSAGETLTDEAAELLKRYARGQIQFVVPDLFWAEIANIFWKAARQGRWSQAAGANAVHTIRERKIPHRCHDHPAGRCFHHCLKLRPYSL